MEKKICSKCKIEKDVCEFYKLPYNKEKVRKKCKSCINQETSFYSKNNRDKRNTLQKKWREKNTEKNIEYRKKNYRINSEKIKLNQKIYRQLNQDKIKNNNKIYYKKNIEKNKERVKKWLKENHNKRLKYLKDWKISNKEKIKEYRQFRYHNDIIYRIRINIRNRVLSFLKSKNITKTNKTFEIVGCSPEFLKEHLEKQFTEGMCWSKIGKEIHIDHIIPLSSAKTKEEIYKLCHYTNLQPLWSIDNLKKSNKILKTN